MLSSFAKNLFLPSLAFIAPVYCNAATAGVSSDTIYSIVDTINMSGVIEVIQPAGLDGRMKSDTDIRYGGEKAAKDLGNDYVRYSIQIFSENKGASSKKNAEYRKRVVEQRMPGTHANIVYDSPYWRVRAGSYRTESEAKAAEREMKSKFPSFAGEIRIVRLRVK